MPVERRERVIAICLGSTGNGRNPMINGRRQPSCGGTSRMMREYQVRFCERLGVKFPGPTRHVSRRLVLYQLRDLSLVMPALLAGIHVFSASPNKDVDGRDKP